MEVQEKLEVQEMLGFRSNYELDFIELCLVLVNYLFNSSV